MLSTHPVNRGHETNIHHWELCSATWTLYWVAQRFAGDQACGSSCTLENRRQQLYNARWGHTSKHDAELYHAGLCYGVHCFSGQHSVKDCSSKFSAVQIQCLKGHMVPLKGPHVFRATVKLPAVQDIAHFSTHSRDWPRVGGMIGPASLTS
jgi:hypothetical protein